MKKIIRPRRWGKTEWMIKESAITGNYIVCANEQVAKSIWMRARDMGLEIAMPISFDDFISGRFRGMGISGFLIDNLDHLAQHIAGYIPVKAVSLSVEFGEQW